MDAVPISGAVEVIVATWRKMFERGRGASACVGVNSADSDSILVRSGAKPSDPRVWDMVDDGDT